MTQKQVSSWIHIRYSSYKHKQLFFSSLFLKVDKRENKSAYLLCENNLYLLVLCSETSDLVFCVADLQFNNQKLQEDVRKLKQAAEAMEESNQKLIDENEELRTQAKMYCIFSIHSH